MLKDKGFEANVEYHHKNNLIILIYEGETVEFNLNDMTIKGNNNPVSEDFRDFIRRRGIKFFTGNRFESITPPSFSFWSEIDS